jgi:hypothetical protein
MFPRIERHEILTAESIRAGAKIVFEIEVHSQEEADWFAGLKAENVLVEALTEEDRQYYLRHVPPTPLHGYLG